MPCDCDSSGVAQLYMKDLCSTVDTDASAVAGKQLCNSLE